MQTRATITAQAFVLRNDGQRFTGVVARPSAVRRRSPAAGFDQLDVIRLYPGVFDDC